MNRHVLTIGPEHVYKSSLRIDGRGWSVADFMGRIFPHDIGKRVYRVGDILQVENDEQRQKRLDRSTTSW